MDIYQDYEYTTEYESYLKDILMSPEKLWMQKFADFLIAIDEKGESFESLCFDCYQGLIMNELPELVEINRQLNLLKEWRRNSENILTEILVRE